MTVCKPEIRKLLSEDPGKWAKSLKSSETLVRKLASGEGTIRMGTAVRFAEAFNAERGTAMPLEAIFELSEIAGTERGRTAVEYEYGAEPLSDDDKAGIIRFLLEGKFNAFGIKIGYVIAVILGIVIVILYKIFTS